LRGPALAQIGREVEMLTRVMHDMRGPEPARAVTDSMPEVIAQVFEDEDDRERPPVEWNRVHAVLIGEQDDAEQNPAEGAPEEDAADADADIRERVAQIVLGAH